MSEKASQHDPLYHPPSAEQIARGETPSLDDLIDRVGNGEFEATRFEDPLSNKAVYAFTPRHQGATEGQQTVDPRLVHEQAIRTEGVNVTKDHQVYHFVKDQDLADHIFRKIKPPEDQ